ncbi:MAG: ABC transporter substrate-binding protein [Myxococcota bacterium]
MVGLWWTLGGCLGLGETVPPAPPLAVDHGVDVAKKRIRIGALNDESGPAKAIGHPFAVGKRVLVAAVNAGGTGVLPDGWTVELVERDHGYVPKEAQRALQTLRDDVLFVSTSFGTDHTLALQEGLSAANLMAFPASLSTALQGHALTPPLGASYEAEARRAVDYLIDDADGRPVRIAVIHQDDAYGRDVAKGAARGAQDYALSVTLALPIAGPGDPEALSDQLSKSSITHVVLGTLPPLTLGLLEAAVSRSSEIAWVGTTPAWSDAFEARPDAKELLARYAQASSLPFWGEEVPGMTEFEKAFATHAPGETPDGYVLMAYVQGMVQLEAVREAIEAGDVTRQGYRKALGGLHHVDAHGMLGALDLSRLPGAVTERVRILKPRLATEGPRFAEVLPQTRPGPRRERPGQAAMDDEASSGSYPGEGADELDAEP